MSLRETVCWEWKLMVILGVQNGRFIYSLVYGTVIHLYVYI